MATRTYIGPTELFREHTDIPEGATPEEKLKMFDPLASAVSDLMDSAIRVDIWRQAEATLQGTFPLDEEVDLSAPPRLQDDIATLEAHYINREHPRTIEHQYFSQPIIRSLGMACVKCAGLHALHEKVQVRSSEAWVVSAEATERERKVLEASPVRVKNEAGKFAGVVIGRQIETPGLEARTNIDPATVLEVRVRQPGRNRVDTGEPGSLSGYDELLLMPAYSTDLFFTQYDK